MVRRSTIGRGEREALQIVPHEPRQGYPEGPLVDGAMVHSLALLWTVVTMTVT